MNKIVLFSLTAMIVVACTTTLELRAQDKAEQGTMKSFGDKITPEGAISTEELLTAMTRTDSLAVKVECEVITSCTKKGCWMDVMLKDGEVMKVRFKDYGFFVPTSGLEGKHAIMEGYAKKETTDVATLQHYAEDAGKSKEEIEKITEPETSLMFLANGVLIAD